MALNNKIFWDHFIDIRSGGPVGYLANLRIGLDDLPLESDVVTWIDRIPKGDIPIAPSTPPTNQDLLNHIAFFENADNFNLSDSEFRRLMRGGIASVHLHTTALAFKVYQALQSRKVSGVPIIVTSHCPESAGKEMADQYRGRDLDEALVNRLEAAVRSIEARGFQCADVWIFPSKEAMEPYIETIPDFLEWSKRKDIRFVATGAVPVRRTVERATAKQKFGLVGQKVLAFIGRHNEVKGYDVFCEAALKLLERRPDLSVLAAGAPSETLRSPAHPRWTELGWYEHPGDVLAAADIFVLPNRMTYYDLVLLEALSIRATTLASATGGNKSVHALTDGAIRLYDGTVDDLVHNATELLDRNSLATRGLQEKLETAYERHFTERAFAARYTDCVRQIHKDYGLRRNVAA